MPLHPCAATWDAIRPPIDLPPITIGSPANSDCAACSASRQDCSSTGARSGTFRPSVLYGKSNVAALMPRWDIPRANCTMNGLVCPAPAPGARINAALGDALK